MPKLKRRSDEDGARVNTLLGEAQRRTLTPDEVKELMWVLTPFYDQPAVYIDGRQFMFDVHLGLLYEQIGKPSDLDSERHYVMFSEDPISTGGVNRGKGPFARLAPLSKKLDIPLPPFPKVPSSVKAKFPELKESWDKWEESVDVWVQNVQGQLS